MSCEEAWRRAEEAKARWLQAESDILASMTPLRGRITSMNESQTNALDPLIELYCAAARETVDALKTAFIMDARHE
jgi:hypothetical protein